MAENMHKKIFFGVDYYPEHWSKDRFHTDVRLMKELDLQVVRMGEFAWSKMEPNEGAFDFLWLEEAIEVLAENGIKTLLGTPTAAPPIWIIEKNPEILPVDEDGHVKGFGGRHHVCMSNDSYREHIRRFVIAMAFHFKDNPHVIGWQVDNELGNSHEHLCMCPNCQIRFQHWLEHKYGSISTLNEAWGTIFWSQTYHRFDQIPVPKTTPTQHNPSLLLDWHRFCSDLIVDFAKNQIDLIRGICKNQPITHNLMGLYDKTDYFDFATHLDFASNDQYPTGYYFTPPGQPPYEIAACMDFIRSVKKKNFWLMELQAGATGGALIGRTPKAGQLMLWTAHCIAHGADTVVYFRFRTCLFGAEQYWHGILPHSGIPGKSYYEIKRTIELLTPVLEDIKDITPHNQVAILFSYDQDWAFKIQPLHPELDYIEQVKLYYNAFYQKNIPLDFINDREAFCQYKLILAPLQTLMDSELEEKLMQYVEQGGSLVLTMRTGAKDRNNQCMSELPLPGKLGKLLGIEIPEYDCLTGKGRNIRWISGQGGYNAWKWTDMVVLKGAEALAAYESGYYQDIPAITKHVYGKGNAYYVGTEPDQELLGRLARELIFDCKLKTNGYTDIGAELAVRKGRENEYLFAINHTDVEKRIEIEKGFKRIGMDGDISDKTVLIPYETRIYYRPLKN